MCLLDAKKGYLLTYLMNLTYDIAQFSLKVALYKFIFTITYNLWY